MNMTVDDRSDAAVIAIKGRFLGSLHGGDLHDILADLKAQGRREVVVDLAKVDFMDSSAIGALIGGLTTMRRDGGDIRLAGLEKRTRDLFVVTRLLGSVFEDYPDAAAAVRSYTLKPPVVLDV